MANLFTVLRLILAPFIIAAVVERNPLLALVLFVCAAATDALDGMAARYWKSTTQLGAYLDPVADKCLLSGVFVGLAVAGMTPVWFVAVIFGRDLYILIAVGCLLWFTPARRFPPSVWGKASTAVQVITATIWLARDAAGLRLLDTVAAAMLWPCAAFTLWSGVHYTWRGLQLARAIDGVCARE